MSLTSKCKMKLKICNNKMKCSEYSVFFSRYWLVIYQTQINTLYEPPKFTFTSGFSSILVQKYLIPNCNYACLQSLQRFSATISTYFLTKGGTADVVDPGGKLVTGLIIVAKCRCKCADNTTKICSSSPSATQHNNKP